MQTCTRAPFVTSLLALVLTAGCGGDSNTPSGPSSAAAGATIAGTVSRTTGTPAALTVAVVGTTLSATVESSGHFQIGSVPAGDVRLKFKDASVDATAQLSNVGPSDFIEIQVQVNGTTATIVSENRSNGKVSLCHRTGSGTYHLIDISVDAEPAHRAHGDAKVGEPVPGTQRQVFDQSCRPTGPAVSLKKSTNGEDADNAPGPSITVGSTVTWRYLVTNTGTINLTDVAVVDDRGVTVNCNGQTALAVAQSMTCTGSGVAAVGPYRNVGTVTANSASGSVTDSDASHYLGVNPPPETGTEGPKVQLCHKTGNGSYHLIEVSVNAEPAHRAHGDGKIGEAVPGSPGKVFGASCTVR
jgi:hypothetical protein